ncbi:hypothetical protein [Fodinibius sp. AD559]|uniref:hypothetical protein n=1 Tax=Fodinibius sp. AD559 TaxID=3424179 RepID=UPI004046B644
MGISHFTDGQVPGATQPAQANPGDKIYIQPTVQVQQVAEGAEIKDSQSKSLCQRLAEEQNGPILSEWFQRNKGTLGLIGLGYLTVRILTRSNN